MPAEINYEYGVCHQHNFIHKCDLQEERLLHEICNLYNRGMSSVKLSLRRRHDRILKDPKRRTRTYITQRVSHLWPLLVR